MDIVFDVLLWCVRSSCPENKQECNSSIIPDTREKQHTHVGRRAQRDCFCDLAELVFPTSNRTAVLTWCTREIHLPSPPPVNNTMLKLRVGYSLPSQSQQQRTHTGRMKMSSSCSVQKWHITDFTWTTTWIKSASGWIKQSITHNH